MNKHKKVWRKRSAFSVIIAASLCLLCSCGTAEKKHSPQWLSGKDFSRHLEISVAYWNINDMAARTEPDAIQAYIENMFNITVKPVPVNWTNYKDYYRMLDATDNLPDVFANLTISSNDTNDSALFEQYVTSGSVRCLPDDLSDYPNLANLFHNISSTRYQDGKYYAIPRMNFLERILSSTDAAMIVRRDWMEALGISDPENMEDFIRMTVAFARDDPDGNGLDDTIGYNVNNRIALGKWLILGIAPECNTYGWTKDKNGSFVPSWTTEGFGNVVETYRRLYRSGGLDPDFHTKTPEVVLEDFASGRLGALEYKSSTGSLSELEDKWLLYNKKPFSQCVDVLHIFPAPDGKCYSNSSSLFWSESFISSKVDDQKLERILCLFEFLLSEDGQRLTKYGIEDVDYTMEKGEFVSLLEASEKGQLRILLDKYPSIALFANLASISGNRSDFEDSPINVQRYGQHCVDLARKDLLWNQENTVQVKRPYEFQLFPKENAGEYSTGNAFDDFVKCIIGSGDAVEMWNQVLNRYREHGLDEYIKKQNLLYQQYLDKVEKSEE